MADYRTEDVTVSVHHYPVDGVQICVDTWDGREWGTVVDRRFICDSFWEAMCDALSYAGYDWDNAVWQCAEWGIEEPDDEEED